MKHTVRVVLRKEKQNSEGLCPVAVCITIARKRTYISTGVRVPEKMWTEGKVKSSYAHSSLLNAKINKALGDAEQILLKEEAAGNTIGIKSARQKVVGGDKDFLSWAKERLLTLKKKEGLKPIARSTYRRWEMELERLSEYTGGRLSFAEVTHIWLNKYRQYLTTVIEPNSIRQAFIVIRRMFNVALEEGLSEHYPFTGWDFPKEIVPTQIYLTNGETEKLLRLLGKESLPPVTQTTLAYFLLECFCGIRNSDWAKFRTERLWKNKQLYLSTTKTGERITIPMKEWPNLNKVVDYIQQNDLTWEYTLQMANRQLKIIAGIAGIRKNVTTHTARHSCAVQLLERGFSIEAIAAVLGISEEIVRRYARLTGRKIQLESLRHGGL